MATSDDATAQNRVIHRDVVWCCPGACDDLQVTVEGSRIVEVRGGCRLGRQYVPLTGDVQSPQALVDGETATLHSAIARAAELLADARAPLIFGLEHLTCEAQSLAVALADRIGATIDSPTSMLSDTRGTSLQPVGEATCTLGELRDRADFVLLWDIFQCHVPCQLFDRLIDASRSGFFGRGRGDQTVILLEEMRRRNASASLADEASIKQRTSTMLAIRERSSFDALWILRALVKGLPLDATMVYERTEVALTDWQHLVERMKACGCGVVAFGTYDPQVARAVNHLVADLNGQSRFSCLDVNKSGMNSVGADHVLAWRAGYPCAVNFAASYPRHGPAEYTASDVLERGEADMALIFGWPNDVRSDAPEALPTRLPAIVIASEADEMFQKAAVFVRVARPGSETSGTIFRFDGVPLSLRAVVSSSLPSPEQVLAEVLKRIGRTETKTYARTQRREGGK